MQLKLIRNKQLGKTPKDRETPEGATKLFVAPKELRTFMSGREYTHYTLYKDGRITRINDKNYSTLENFF